MAELIYRPDSAHPLCTVLGELTIYSAEPLWVALLDAVHEHPQLELDLAAVSDFDSSGVQILLMLKREAQRLGKQLSLSNHSPVVREVLDLLNLVAELGDPLIIPGDQS